MADFDKPRVLSFATANVDGALPPNAVYIGHARPEHELAASKWDTPYRPETHGTAEDESGKWDECVFMHRVWLPVRPDLMAAVGELRGKDLVCWYVEDGRSHGDVLLEMANR